MEEKNIHILKKAIDELPRYAPHKDVFSSIETELNNNKSGKLKLKEYSPDENFWSKIEQRLDVELPNQKQEDVLKRAISELPTYEPNEISWEHISKTLVKQQTKIISINSWFKPLSYAASITLIIGLFIFYFTKSPQKINEKVTIAYSEEIVDNNQLNQTDTKNPAEEDEVLKLVDAQCSNFSEVCDNEYFKGLLKQYQELKTIEVKTQKMLEDNSEEITIQNSLIRIDKEKTKISKKIIQLLI